MTETPGETQFDRTVRLFWSHVDRGADCWTWSAYTDNFGYGQYRFRPTAARPRLTAAHRVSWMLSVGPIPAGLCVLHRCDNPPCVRPDHLFLGTKADNTRDMLSKGRWRQPPVHRGRSNWSHINRELMPRGERHGMARLTEAQVAAIRARFRPDVKGMKAALAREFGVSKTHIGRILSARNWAPQ